MPRKTKDELAKDTPGYLPPGQRPKCLCCDRELILNIHHPWSGHLRLDYEKVEKVGYGYQDNGIFCTNRCGYEYGLAVAKMVLHRQKRERGSSGNPLIDNGSIPAPKES